jgi:septum formation protein
VTELVLASSSPRRAELLRAAGYRFRVDAPEVDETPLAGERPAEMVERLAAAKAAACGELDAVVLAADTIVTIDGDLLGKPADRQEAIAMLERLSGRSHRVVTGWTVRRPDAQVTAHTETTVRFRRLVAAEIIAYVDSGEPLDRAGAYAIQGGACGFVAALDGPYDNVVGLPVGHIAQVLARFGIHPDR